MRSLDFLQGCKVLPPILHSHGTKEDHVGTSLMVQWLIIHLPVQGTWVQSLVREDPIHPVCLNYRVHVLQVLKLVPLDSMLCNKRSRCSEIPAPHNETQSLLSATMRTQHDQK